MKNTRKTAGKATSLIMALALALAPAPAWAAETNVTADAFTLGGESACDYYLYGTIPTYVRSLPISDDDPAGDSVDDAAHIRYQYGYAFQDVNGYYYYNRVTDEWEGEAPLMDTGVLIGGNARSKHDAVQLDSDSIDFADVLPYADLYIDSTKLSYTEGSIEYEFFTDDFNFNYSLGTMPENITVKGNDTLTAYQEKFPSFDYPRKREAELPVDWEGVVYTGGIAKTVAGARGTLNETVVENAGQQGEGALFTVRYRDAVIDKAGATYDLVLSFTRFTFVAEADVTGPIGILEDDNLYVAPILCDENGDYLVTMQDSSNQVDVHDSDGVRVGARFEFDYRVEDASGELADGLIFYSMNDLDNASMATALQTDADWGRNDLGNDFAWAEGFGVVDGAASFAVVPYFNHEMRDVYDQVINNLNGDSSLLRISRMEGSVPDGTANGLYFTTSITSVSGIGARNDANTHDTGMAALLHSSGSMVAAISSGRRGDVNIAFFDNSAASSIVQTAAGNGRIVSLDRSMRGAGDVVENADYLKVVGNGSTSTHLVQPDPGNHLYSIAIDGQEFRYRDMEWQELADGTFEATIEVADEYGKTSGKTEYTLVRDPDDSITLSFESVQDDHEVHVEFVPNGLFGMFREVTWRSVITVGLVAGFLLLIFISTIAWMKRGGKEYEPMP